MLKIGKRGDGRWFERSERINSRHCFFNYCVPPSGRSAGRGILVLGGVIRCDTQDSAVLEWLNVPERTKGVRAKRIKIWVSRLSCNE